MNNIKRQELRREQYRVRQEQARIDKEIEKLDRENKENYEKDLKIVSEKLKNILKRGKNEKENQVNTAVKNTIITAPTQVGKTNTIIELCKSCEGWVSVISCDNKIDQLNQLLNRVKGEEINVYSLDSAYKNMTEVINHITNKENIVIVILNNETQVSKLTSFIQKIWKKVAIKKYICIHDESDMVNKSDDIKNLTNKKIPKSHREWIGHFQIMKSLNISLIRRIWVTATAENCSLLFDIKAKDILVLPSPADYRQVNTHLIWSGNSNQELTYEIERIRTAKNGEVILYCCERLIKDQTTLAHKISRENNCITVVYNSKDTVIFGNNIKLEVNDSIDQILSKLKQETDNTPVVIFGCDLMNRGLSFVGKGIDPYTATVMFYKGGLKSHAIGLVQKIGRITGSARPDLEDRKIYCTKEIYDDYNNYLSNQQAVYSAIKENPELNMNQILRIVGSEKLKRPVDRPALKKVNKQYSDSSETDSGVDVAPTAPDTDKMRRLVSSWSKTTNKTEVAKLFREMIGNGGSLMNSLIRDLIDNNDGEIHHLTADYRKWNTVFYKDDTNHYIRDEAMKFYDTLQHMK